MTDTSHIHHYVPEGDGGYKNWKEKQNHGKLFEDTKPTCGKFIKNTKYYTGTVWEWNLPAGWSCPFAKECEVKVSRNTGKFDIAGGSFRCYAASAERFPAVREHRWKNYEYVTGGGSPSLPVGCENVRIHSSGDFFSQAYFDMWVKLCAEHPEVNFWAFTKSIPFWADRIENIPDNMILTASYGGRYDRLIEELNLKSARVYASLEEVPDGMPIDNNDDWARVPNVSFALLDNNKFSKKQKYGN